VILVKRHLEIYGVQFYSFFNHSFLYLGIDNTFGAKQCVYLWLYVMVLEDKTIL